MDKIKSIKFFTLLLSLFVSAGAFASSKVLCQSSTDSSLAASNLNVYISREGSVSISEPTIIVNNDNYTICVSVNPK